MAMNCNQPNWVGNAVLVEALVACGDIDPRLSVDFFAIGSIRGKEFNSSADTVDTTADDSAGQVRTALVTYKSAEISLDGISKRDDGTTSNQTMLYKHFWNESQPTCWLRFTYPDITIYAYVVMSAFNRSAPHDDVGTWSMEAAATGTGTALINPVMIEDTPIPVSSITVTPATASIAIAGTQQLTAVVLPVTAPQTVVWTSDTPAVATVNSSGLVTGVSAGSAIITGTAGTKTDTCVVTVTA